MSAEQNGRGSSPIGSVTRDASGRRVVQLDDLTGIAEAVVIDPVVWDVLHARNAGMSDRQLAELHHDDFAHGAMEALKQRPSERPVVVNIYDVRMARRTPAN